MKVQKKSIKQAKKKTGVHLTSVNSQRPDSTSPLEAILNAKNEGRLTTVGSGTVFKDTQDSIVRHLNDDSDVSFKQASKGVNLHYAYERGERYGNRKVIEAAIQSQEELNLANTSLHYKNGTSHCNQAVQDIMRMLESIPGMGKVLVTGRANEMIDELMDNKYPNYHAVTLEEARAHADAGGFAIVCYRATSGSGHVAAFTVGELRTGKQDIANIGLANNTGYVTLNAAISSKKKKSYFIYQPDTLEES